MKSFVAVAVILASLAIGGWSSGVLACDAYRGDANGDLVVDIDDVLYVVSVWATTDEAGDFNDDGLVAVDDLLIVLEYFGQDWSQGGITHPSEECPCEYLCGLDRNDPSGWPPEFQTAPPEVIQSIWDILIDGLLDSYGCDPCPIVPVLTGACCNYTTGACVDDITEADCIFPGTEWLGEGSTCDDDCD